MANRLPNLNDPLLRVPGRDVKNCNEQKDDINLQFWQSVSCPNVLEKCPGVDFEEIQRRQGLGTERREGELP